IGDPQDAATDVGALVSEPHLRKVEGYVELAREEGGSILAGGGRPENLPERVRDGYFLEPTVIAGLDCQRRVMQEEIFGPVVTVTPFDSPDEAIAYANSTRYGLSASVWTRDLQKAHRVAAAIESGTVWVNTWLLRDLRVPFGGMKESGVGREGGVDSLEFFTEAKNVCTKLNLSARRRRFPPREAPKSPQSAAAWPLRHRAQPFCAHQPAAGHRAPGLCPGRSDARARSRPGSDPRAARHGLSCRRSGAPLPAPGHRRGLLRQLWFPAARDGGPAAAARGAARMERQDEDACAGRAGLRARARRRPRPGPSGAFRPWSHPEVGQRVES